MRIPVTRLAGSVAESKTPQGEHDDSTGFGSLSVSVRGHLDRADTAGERRVLTLWNSCNVGFRRVRAVGRSSSPAGGGIRARASHRYICCADELICSLCAAPDSISPFESSGIGDFADLGSFRVGSTAGRPCLGRQSDVPQRAFMLDSKRSCHAPRLPRYQAFSEGVAIPRSFPRSKLLGMESASTRCRSPRAGSRRVTRTSKM